MLANLLLVFTHQSLARQWFAIALSFAVSSAPRNALRYDTAGHSNAMPPELRYARGMHWTCPGFALEDAWSAARTAVKGRPPGKSIIDDAIARGLHPRQFSDARLEEWGHRQIDKGCRHVSSRQGQGQFRLAIRRAGLQKQFPLLTCPDRIPYRIRPRELTSPVRSEIAAILWRMRAEARLDRVSFRWSSARRVVLRFQELAGFARLVLGISNPQCLEQLLTKPVIRKFIRWLHSEKNCAVGSIGSQVNRIRNVLRWHPTLGERDFTWMKALVEEISDPEEELAARCLGPVALRSDLIKVPNKIRAKRRRLQEQDPRLEAWLVQMELLMFLLITQPWPPLCIRKCRIKGDRPNLFRGPVPRDNYPFTLTVQAQRAFEKNSRVRLWQYCFTPAETREQRMARGLVVQHLIPLLERFINQHRDVLVGSKPDPETLFVTSSGRAFESEAFASLVGETCLEYLDVRLTPYQIRRIYALDWLAQHREDPNRYEKLAISLWVEPSSVIAEYGPEDRIYLPRRNAPRRAFRIRPVRIPQ